MVQQTIIKYIIDIYLQLMIKYLCDFLRKYNVLFMTYAMQHKVSNRKFTKSSRHTLPVVYYLNVIIVKVQYNVEHIQADFCVNLDCFLVLS